MEIEKLRRTCFEAYDRIKLRYDVEYGSRSMYDTNFNWQKCAFKDCSNTMPEWGLYQLRRHDKLLKVCPPCHYLHFFNGIFKKEVNNEVQPSTGDVQMV